MVFLHGNFFGYFLKSISINLNFFQMNEDDNKLYTNGNVCIFI